MDHSQSWTENTFFSPGLRTFFAIVAEEIVYFWGVGFVRKLELAFRNRGPPPDHGHGASWSWHEKDQCTRRVRKISHPLHTYTEPPQ